jgi:hypothetical protein
MRRAALALLVMARSALAMPTLEVTADPPRLVPGEGDRAHLAVKLAGGTAAPGAHPRFSTTLGTIEGDVYDPGRTRMPAVAIVAATLALAGGGEARGAVRVVLVGSGTLPTHTSPGASVTVVIEGRTFGPVVADDSGDALVPVNPPPGAEIATVNSVEPSGLSTSRDVRLPQASARTALLVGPERIDPTGTATVIAVVPEGARARTPPKLDARGPIAAGEPSSAGPGRWDLPVRATGEGTGELDAAGAAPIEIATYRSWSIGPRLGIESGDPDALIAADLRYRRGMLFGAIEIGAAAGAESHAELAAAVGLTIGLGATDFAVEPSFGIGAALGSPTNRPLFEAGAAFAWRRLFVDVRWEGIRPNAAVVAVGWRFSL